MKMGYLVGVPFLEELGDFVGVFLAQLLGEHHQRPEQKMAR